MATYTECLPLISELQHKDKLRLAQWLINTIAQEEGVDDSRSNSQTGLCGIWQDSRPSEELVEEMISNRTQGRDITI